ENESPQASKVGPELNQLKLKYSRRAGNDKSNLNSFPASAGSWITLEGIEVDEHKLGTNNLGKDTQAEWNIARFAAHLISEGSPMELGDKSKSVPN
ncbi:hypothetical protein Ancab_021645, partial [Ancistrocladus abbreviatus]